MADHGKAGQLLVQALKAALDEGGLGFAERSQVRIHLVTGMAYGPEATVPVWATGPDSMPIWVGAVPPNLVPRPTLDALVQSWRDQAAAAGPQRPATRDLLHACANELQEALTWARQGT